MARKEGCICDHEIMKSHLVGRCFIEDCACDIKIKSKIRINRFILGIFISYLVGTGFGYLIVDLFK